MKTETRTSAAPPLICDLGALAAPDLAVVDALARLRRAAARHGVRLVLRNANGPLRELLAFSGQAPRRGAPRRRARAPAGRGRRARGPAPPAPRA
ncbi:STAS domain-containing protein, partial [Kitasatospora purpeofusca]|uniref:STAS domain-containing protein n=1 Tax=Kitasatospora purpeofusca TaxID=67352 RepID=UPI00369C34DC